MYVSLPPPDVFGVLHARAACVRVSECTAAALSTVNCVRKPATSLAIAHNVGMKMSIIMCTPQSVHTTHTHGRLLLVRFSRRTHALSLSLILIRNSSVSPPLSRSRSVSRPNHPVPGSVVVVVVVVTVSRVVQPPPTRVARQPVVVISNYRVK